MEERIIKLEVTQEHHALEIKELKESNKTLTESFSSFSKNIAAIKNWIIGGVTLAIIQQIGLIEFLKKIIF